MPKANASPFFGKNTPKHTINDSDDGGDIDDESCEAMNDSHTKNGGPLKPIEFANSRIKKAK